MSKRLDTLDWDTFFIEICKLAGKRSKDPNTQVGACIVTTNNLVCGLGYNGFPRGCSDDEFPWSKPEKNLYVCHAEQNAILNVTNWGLVKESRLYTTLFPCNECAKIIIQSGVKKIVYLEDKHDGTDTNRASKKMFEAAGVEIEKFIPKQPVTIRPATVRSATIDIRRKRVKKFLALSVTFSTFVFVYKLVKWAVFRSS